MKKLLIQSLILLSALLLISSENSTHYHASQPFVQQNQCEEEACVTFSLDRGETWIETDDRLIDFDIWETQTNDEVPHMVFFSATSFNDYVLLFYFKGETNISENYVYNVEINDNELSLNINRFEGMLTALSSWL